MDHHHHHHQARSLRVTTKKIPKLVASKVLFYVLAL